MAFKVERRSAYRVWLIGLREKPLERSCRKWNDDIKMGIKVVGLGGMDWIDLKRTGQLPRKDSAAWSYQ